MLCMFTQTLFSLFAMKLLTENKLKVMLGVIIRGVIVIAKVNECQLKQTKHLEFSKLSIFGQEQPNSYGLVFFPNYKVEL